jgi:hypothetical protein
MESFEKMGTSLWSFSPESRWGSTSLNDDLLHTDLHALFRCSWCVANCLLSMQAVRVFIHCLSLWLCIRIFHNRDHSRATLVHTSQSPEHCCAHMCT